MLDYVMELLPSPMDKDVIVGTNPDTDEPVDEIVHLAVAKIPQCESGQPAVAGS
jgi:elongation factor G